MEELITSLSLDALIREVDRPLWRQAAWARIDELNKNRTFVQGTVDLAIKRILALERQVDALKTALSAECHGESCGDGCCGGYRTCSGCNARAKAALESGPA